MKINKMESNIEFIKVCNSNELIPKKGKLIKFDEDDDMQIAIFRINENLYAVSNICPHRHAEEIYNGLLSCQTDENQINNKLEDSEIQKESTQKTEKDVVTCPLHGWSYFLDTGYNTNPKQGIKRITTYQIFEKNGEIYIEKPKLDIPKWRK